MKWLFALLLFIGAAGCLHPAPAPSGTDWDAVAQCETGGNWGALGPTYQGGLGIWHGNWGDNGGYEFADNAGRATREQQIIVAERILARYGWAWGCPRP